MSTSSKKRPIRRRAAKAAPAAAPYHHGNLRAALLQAAGRMLEDQGPDALSLRAVARLVGVSHNAPYRHFPTREDLLSALAAEGFRALQQATGKARAKTGADTIDAMGLAYVEFALANPQRYRLMFGAGKAQSAELSESAKAAFQQLAGAAPARFGAAPGVAAVRAWAFVHGIADLLLEQQINPVLMAGRTPLQFAALLLGKSS
jgi:AcrR family transcriptional regulator